MTLTAVLLGLLLGLAFFVVSTAAVMFVVARLPAEHFCRRDYSAACSDRHPVWVWTKRIGKNLIGIAAVLLGVALSLPGVPGPGVVLVLLGIALVDFPGKHRLERKVLSRPRVIQTINSFRARFGKPPLVLDGDSPEASGASATDGKRK